jgi:hypothetical protein
MNDDVKKWEGTLPREALNYKADFKRDMGRHKRDGEAVDSLMSFIRRWCLRASGYGQK